MNQIEIIAGLTNANNILFNLLIRALDSHKIINRELLRDQLFEVVRECKPVPGLARYDMAQFQSLAKLLSDPDLEPR